MTTTHTKVAQCDLCLVTVTAEVDPAGRILLVDAPHHRDRCAMFHKDCSGMFVVCSNPEPMGRRRARGLMRYLDPLAMSDVEVVQTVQDLLDLFGDDIDGLDLLDFANGAETRSDHLVQLPVDLCELRPNVGALEVARAWRQVSAELVEATFEGSRDGRVVPFVRNSNLDDCGGDPFEF